MASIKKLILPRSSFVLIQTHFYCVCFCCNRLQKWNTKFYIFSMCLRSGLQATLKLIMGGLIQKYDLCRGLARGAKLVFILGPPLFAPLQLAKDWFQTKDYFGHPVGRPMDSHVLHIQQRSNQRAAALQTRFYIICINALFLQSLTLHF